MATIKEDYVSFEVAKLLKEKGFQAKCTACYSSDLNHTFQLISGRINYCNPRFRKYKSIPPYNAPTLQMAMKWLREVHNMYYEIQLLLGEKAEKYGDFQLGIYQLNSSGTYKWKDWIYADSYVELYENYIKYCLEHLIK